MQTTQISGHHKLFKKIYKNIGQIGAAPSIQTKEPREQGKDRTENNRKLLDKNVGGMNSKLADDTIINDIVDSK